MIQKKEIMIIIENLVVEILVEIIISTIKVALVILKILIQGISSMNFLGGIILLKISEEILDLDLMMTIIIMIFFKI